MARRRRRAAVPNVAIIPWGDVVEDYTAPIGLTLTDYLTALSGGWLFGYVQALASAGVTSTVVVWSSTVRRRQRCLHVPTGATVWVLPPSRTWRRLRPHIRGRWVAQPERGPVSRLARAVVPYAATTPFQLARVLREEACTSVLTQEYEEARFDVCVVLGRLLGLPVFATFQGGDLTRTRLERITRRPAVRAAAGFLVHDSREVGRLVARYGVDAERIARIPNPFDARTVPVVARGEARRRLGLTPADRVVAWHGRVDVTPKGIDVLVDAWEEISRRDGGAVLTLLGTGAGAPWLAERIRARELRGVRWRDEYVLDRDTVGAHLSAADVYVLPSRQEGLPVAIIEAMATGLPVVAADAPGVRDIIGSGDDAAGVVVPVEDPVALADAVLALLDDPDRRAALGERGRRRVDDELSLVAVGRALRDVLVAR
jgi:starch synthase